MNARSEELESVETGYRSEVGWMMIKALANSDCDINDNHKINHDDDYDSDFYDEDWL